MGVSLCEWQRIAGDLLAKYDDSAEPPEVKPVGRPKKPEVSPDEATVQGAEGFETQKAAMPDACKGSTAPVYAGPELCALCRKRLRIERDFVPDPACPRCKAVRMQE